MIVHWRRALDSPLRTCKTSREISGRILQGETRSSSDHKRRDAPHPSQRELTSGFDGILWHTQPMVFDQPRGVELEFDAVNTSPFPSHPRMPLFKKSKKPRQPSQKLVSLATRIAVGPLGISADLDPEISSEGTFSPTKPINR